MREFIKTAQYFVVVSFLAFMVFKPCNGQDNLPESEKRYGIITKILKSYKKAGENFADPKVKESIYKDIKNEMILEPQKKPDKRTYKELAETARNSIADSFKESPEQIKEKAEQIAADRFKMHKPLDEVSVHYKKGDRFFSARGIFYSYGGNSIKVGDKVIAIYDLTEESRIKFDKTYSETKRKQFIDNKLKEYYAEKTKRSLEVYKELKDKQIAQNEEAGYIYIWKEWRTPKEIADILIRSVEKNVRPSKTASIAKNGDKAEEKPEEAQEDAAHVTEEGIEEQAAKMYRKVKQKAEKQLLEIANTQAGIDADQGYKMALWGMTLEEVGILLTKGEYYKRTHGGKENNNFKNEEEDELIQIQTDKIVIENGSGPIEKVELGFFYDSFYKVIVEFRIGTMAAMQRVGALLNERYGFTDEQKKVMVKKEKLKKGEAAEEEILAFQEESDKQQNQNKDVPLEQTYHWTGKITFGKVEIKLNSDYTYSSFALIKESPDVKEAAKAKKLKEEQRKREEKRRKELEEYNKRKIEF